ncbi:MAG: FAD-binding protein [Pseudomonadales bacterium]|nr:FAD-dependent monooxygenase [Gammaproteobacteria bacterium]NNL57448.1 FAD-binding protein [Pseudomonadales bacterium]
MRVLIAGAGIGGLTTALCCLQRGHEVILFEQAQALTEVGAGIQLPPNAMRVFQALGVADQIAAHAFVPKALEARMGRSGRRLFRLPLAKRVEKNWRAPYLHIHRADYISALTKALLVLAPRALHLGAQVLRYAEAGSSVAVELSDGETVTGDLLVAADGIHSTIRAQLAGAEQPRFTGHVAWRAVVPIEQLGKYLPPPTACVWMGRGKHAVTYRLRRGTLANFVGVVECSEWGKESWSEQGSRDQALADFSDWHSLVPGLIAAADTLYRWALFDRAPLHNWVQGRVALLGDAAHPMLPFMAQGAAMAVEDAWIIAAALGEQNRTVTDSLLAYQRARHARATAVQGAAAANASRFHQRSVAGQLMTYGPMWLAGHVLPSLIHQRTNWLYQYDVTAAV